MHKVNEAPQAASDTNKNELVPFVEANPVRNAEHKHLNNVAELQDEVTYMDLWLLFVVMVHLAHLVAGAAFALMCAVNCSRQ